MNGNQRVIARDRAVSAALLGLHHAGALHYTEGKERWEGIAKKRIASHGEFPAHADCSSFVTWCLWNALHVPFGCDDVVNGEKWEAGYTGTLAENGRLVSHPDNALPGDVVLYGTGAPFFHTALIVGHKDGKPVVVSNGSEGGPYLLTYDYRTDVGEIRRYITADVLVP